MSTTLNDKNISSVIKDIPKKGFTVKFWQDHRSAFVQGSGVAKCLKALKDRGVPPSGDPSGVPPKEMEHVIDWFYKLDSALAKAKKKCGKPQSHTEKFCAAFIKVVLKRLEEAQRLLKNASKAEAAQEKQRQDTDKELQKFKKQQEKQQELVLDELADLDKRAKNMAKACEEMTKDIKLATADVNKLIKGLETQRNGDGKIAPDLGKRFENGLTAIQKKYKLPLHGQNLKSSLPKVLKELTSLFQQYLKLDYAKRERISAGASLKEAQDGLKAANASFKIYAESHKKLALAFKETA
ncbi:hypothetical protein [Leisingera sp. McT4-56]|uniref:hypothetical protein n=1 Tax=Leisingera sp. McT4-56 TaxID=2881255 RepID=UPI001CF90892|nr:hypothetical protein [Leisingera sp. McT4-56]MCB4455993.1 hypothetical protein [Leisingera sp. McT4-56]